MPRIPPKLTPAPALSHSQCSSISTSLSRRALYKCRVGALIFPSSPLSSRLPLSSRPPPPTTRRRHAAGGEVPAGVPRRDGVRVQVDGGGRDGGVPGPGRGDGHHHGRHVGDRGGDGAGAGEARRAGRHPGAERQGRRGHARPHPGRVPRRRRPRAPARPQLARLRPRLRRPLPRPRPPAPPPHKQCRQVLARPARALGGRRRDDLRHQLPRALFADEAAAGAHGGDGGGDRRAGPHRQRVVQRARMVRRRLGRVPPPRHPTQHTLRRDAGVRGVQARQRAAHPRARRAPAGNGRQRDGELRPPGDRQDPPQPRPRRRPHRSGVLAAVQAAENDPSGCGDHVLRGGPPEGGRRVRPLLRRLQRGPAVAGRHQPPRGRAPLAHLRGHRRRPPPRPQRRRAAVGPCPAAAAGCGAHRNKNLMVMETCMHARRLYNSTSYNTSSSIIINTSSST